MATSLPESWQIRSLGTLVTFLDSQRVPIRKSDRASMRGPYPYYGASGIIDYVNDYLFDEQLVLLAEDGANILMRGSPIAFMVSGKVWVNNHAHVLRPKPGTNIGFLIAYLESLSYERYNSGTAQPKLNRKTCEGIEVLVPPLPEQRKITEILTTWDDALALLDRRIELARERKKGLMQRLLTGRVRFPEFEGEEWRETRLDKVVERVTRRNSEGCQNVLTMSAQRGLISQTEYYNKRIAAKDVSHYYLLRQGEFAYNKSTSKGYPFGAIKRLDDYAEGVLSTLYVCFRLCEDRRVSSDFLAHYFEGGQLDRGIYSIAQEGARNHGLLNISLADFFALQLRLPSTAEQHRIAEVLQACDEEIALLERKRELTAQQKKGLMQRLLTGRVRVSEKARKRKGEKAKGREPRPCRTPSTSYSLLLSPVVELKADR